MRQRCTWVNKANKQYIEYHDKEWGVPVHSDRQLFEMLILEGAQAGLSWETILKRREGYRAAFDNFDINKVAAYTEEKQQELLQDAGIIRNKLKVASAVRNAGVMLALQREFGSFYNYLQSMPQSAEEISKDLKKRGMSFVGPTIIYAFMQATGMVNDHDKACYRYKEL